MTARGNVCHLMRTLFDSSRHKLSIKAHMSPLFNICRLAAGEKCAVARQEQLLRVDGSEMLHDDAKR